MNGINLIPAPRLAAKRRRAHLHCCAAACVCWTVLALGAAGLAHAIWREEDPQAAERLAKVNEEMQRTDRVIAGMRADLSAAQSTLRANQTIATQPDWSIMLGLLGQQVGDDIVLKSCRVRPSSVARTAAPAARRGVPRAAAPAADAAQSSEPPPFALDISGMALDHAAANKFLLRLEQTGLFTKVSLLDTAREPFFDKNAVAFRLECALNQLPPQDPAGGPVTGAAASARGGE
jgi:hypothetical protein